MSTDAHPMPLIDPRAYNAARAEAIALEYATGEPGTGLADLHKAAPDAIPPPLVIRRWRSVFPAFDALMREAEQARALALMEATIAIADDAKRDAAGAKNAIAVRWRMAEALHPENYAARRAADAPGDPAAGRGLRLLTDAQLLAIARGVDPSKVLEHDPPSPHSPPHTATTGETAGACDTPHLQYSPAQALEA